MLETEVKKYSQGIYTYPILWNRNEKWNFLYYLTS